MEKVWVVLGNFEESFWVAKVFNNKSSAIDFANYANVNDDCNFYSVEGCEVEESFV